MVAHARRLLELQVARVLQHQLFQPLDLARDVLLGHLLDPRSRHLRRQHLGVGAAALVAVDAVDQIPHLLDDAARRDAMLGVEGDLAGAAALGLAHGLFHRFGDPVGVQDGLAVHVARRAADGLDE